MIAPEKGARSYSPDSNFLCSPSAGFAIQPTISFAQIAEIVKFGKGARVPPLVRNGGQLHSSCHTMVNAGDPAIDSGGTASF